MPRINRILLILFLIKKNSVGEHFLKTSMFENFYFRKLQFLKTSIIEISYFLNYILTQCRRNSTTELTLLTTSLFMIKDNSITGKSFSEALIHATTNPQYDKRLFIDLPVQYMKTTSSEHVVYINCFLF